MVTDEQITLYALGALDAHDATEFERQVASSPDLRRRVAEEKAAAIAFLLATPPVTPPAALKTKVMARVGADMTSMTSMTSVPSSTNATNVTSLGQTEQAVKRPRARRANIGRILFGGLSAVMAALALIFGIGWYRTQSQLVQLRNTFSDTQAQLVVSEARVSDLSKNLAQAKADLDQMHVTLKTAETDTSQVKTDLASAQAKVDQAASDLAASQLELAVLHQSVVRTTALSSGRAGFEHGIVHVFYSPDGKSALLTVSNLPKLGADKTYEVWLIKGSQRLPSNVFNVSDDGTSHLVVQSTEPFSAFQNLAITIEPAGGRPTPSLDGPVYLGALS